MKIIKEKILFEEMQSLVMGKTIDFLDIADHDLQIKISGEDVKNFFETDVETLETEYIKNQIELLTRELDNRKQKKFKEITIEIKDERDNVISDYTSDKFENEHDLLQSLLEDIQEQLSEDILERYDNVEHWDRNMSEEYFSIIKMLEEKVQK